MSPPRASGALQPTPGAKREATQRDTLALVSERDRLPRPIPTAGGDAA